MSNSDDWAKNLHRQRQQAEDSIALNRGDLERQFNAAVSRCDGIVRKLLTEVGHAYYGSSETEANDTKSSWIARWLQSKLGQSGGDGARYTISSGNRVQDGREAYWELEHAGSVRLSVMLQVDVNSHPVCFVVWHHPATYRNKVSDDRYRSNDMSERALRDLIHIFVMDNGLFQPPRKRRD